MGKVHCYWILDKGGQSKKKHLQTLRYHWCKTWKQEKGIYDIRGRKREEGGRNNVLPSWWWPWPVKTANHTRPTSLLFGMSKPVPKGKDVHLKSIMLIFNQRLIYVVFFCMSLQKGSKFFLLLRGNTSKNEIRAGYAEAGILIRIISISRKKPKTSVSGGFCWAQHFHW